MKALGRILLVVLVPFCLVWVLAAPRMHTGRHARPHVYATAAIAPLPFDDDSPAVPAPRAQPDSQSAQPQAEESETDLYGNDVSDAVAEYGLDATGSLYEMHAPQVELPHLGSPKS